MSTPDNQTAPATGDFDLTWRSLIDALTPLQVQRYVEWELSMPGDAAWQAVLLLNARDDAEANRADRERFGEVPEPAGATVAWHWAQTGTNGPWERSWEGRNFRFRRFYAEVRGTQRPDGTNSELCANIDCSGQDFTALDLRRIAVGLVDLADELERIAGT